MKGDKIPVKSTDCWNESLLKIQIMIFSLNLVLDYCRVTLNYHQHEERNVCLFPVADPSGNKGLDEIWRMVNEILFLENEYYP